MATTSRSVKASRHRPIESQCSPSTMAGNNVSARPLIANPPSINVRDARLER
jgi:hypothetical protein